MATVRNLLIDFRLTDVLVMYWN